MKSIKDIAKMTTSNSELLQGREKKNTEDIIKEFSAGITITDFDAVQTKRGMGYVFTYAEEKGYFVFAGQVLNNIFENILKEFEGDLQAARAAMRKDTLKVKLAEATTQTGNTYTSVQVL